jgi:hypothetical protein
MRMLLVTTVRSAIVLELHREPVGGGARREPDRRARAHLVAGRDRDGRLLVDVAHRLGGEAGLVGARLIGQCRTAVDLGDEPVLVERVEVAADGHVAHAEQRGEVRDADRAAPAQLADDHLVSLLRERATPSRRHGDSVHQRRSEVNKIEHENVAGAWC